MAKNFTTVVSIEPQNGIVRFFSAEGNDKKSMQVLTKPISVTDITSDKFIESFAGVLNEYSATKPSFTGKAAQVTIVLPNNYIYTDVFNVPTDKKQKMEDMLLVSLEGMFKNYQDLKFNKMALATNKQFSTYQITAIRSLIVQSLYTACSQSNMFADVLTYQGSGLANAIVNIQPKYKNETVVAVDIKATTTHIAYIVKGSCLGGFDLPFGRDVLLSEKPIAENMLFDHQVAELAVLNAREKAKAKQLTTMGYSEEEDDTGFDSVFVDHSFSQSETNTTIKVLPKKTPRVLPKFMQRPEPQTDEEKVYENFRIFQKYILEFIQMNSAISSLCKVDVVSLVIPSNISFLIDMINKEEAETGIKFEMLDLSKETDVIRNNLELYGALFAGVYNRQNSF